MNRSDNHSEPSILDLLHEISNSSQENDNIHVVLPNINNDHLVEPLVTNIAKTEAPQRPEITFQIKFTALADYPTLPCPSRPKLPKLPCPP
ncbi:hypothetical protein H5410_002793 [Solanum commersonii]|uniref:Uncharacterized protein n=1 Tax=Solanum commersonii TaxID=4109 RepID=A0A9J6B362_SOLCO|nr:hypothetical protein H5410_002793 [Solanum commersonii]